MTFAEILTMLLDFCIRCCIVLSIIGLFGKRCAIESRGIAMLKGEEVARTNHTIPGCWLGGKFYLIGERWSPVIEPYGLMVCVKCQCASIIHQKTLDKVGKVMCRNIKYECPEASCPDPILRPNTCCKVCQNQVPYFEDTFTLVQNDLPFSSTDTAPDQTVTDMSALLVGRGPSRTRAVALMHVTLLHGNSFQYALRYTRLRHAERIVLQDKFGTVIQQQRLQQQTSKQGKICGIWRDLPQVYMQYITQERIFVSITTRKSRYGEITGKLVEDTRFKTATFEGLLSPSRKTGAGGRFDIKYDIKARLAFFSIQFENLRQSGRGMNDYFVTLEKGGTVVFQRVIKADTDDQMLTGKLKLDSELSRRIARGRLFVRVTSRSGESLRGKVQPRLSCSTYMAALMTHRDTSDVSYAMVQLNEDSSLRYKVVVATQHTHVQDIMLKRLNVNRNVWKSMAILTHMYSTSQTETGQAVGEYKKMRAIDTCSLLEEEVFASIRLHSNIDELRGRLMEVPFIEHIDVFEDHPLVMTSASCSLTVYVWLVVDNACHVRYHIMTSGLTNTENQIIIKLTSAVYWNRYNSQNVTEYTFNEMSGIIKTVPENVFTSLQFGDNYIDASLPANPGCESLRTPLFRPNTCWNQQVHTGKDSGGNSIETSGGGAYRCYYSDRIYSHGDSWIPEDHECFTCRCKHGHVHCDKVICPPSNCTHAVIPNGQCCPVCEEENSTEKKPIGSCYFSGDKRWHLYGTTWHPYIPPLGYTRCAICSCIPGTGDVNCSRLPCPKLDCPQSQRIRRNPDDCCQTCLVPNDRVYLNSDTTSTRRNHKKACEFGEKIYSHGETWHPSLTPFGEMTCYLCRCKNGDTKCSKIQCQPLLCDRQYRPAGQCCPVCLEGMYNRKQRRKSSNG